MKIPVRRFRSFLLTVLLVAGPAGPVAAEQGPPTLMTAPGVDFGGHVLTVGALNDESGPGAAIGRPYAIGKRILVAAVNSGQGKLLPRGWRIELVERDHGYQLERARQQFAELENQVFFFMTSFGTHLTNALVPGLRRGDIVAFPASLYSGLAAQPHTPVLGASYRRESMRAMDWVVEAGETSVIRTGVVYQGDQYGLDGLDGWRTAADFHKIPMVAQEEYAPGHADFTAIVQRLQEARATHVFLSTLPSATGRLLKRAREIGYHPVWLGNTASWSDTFFDARSVSAEAFRNYYWVTGFPYWGEDVPIMEEFLDAFLANADDRSYEDFYILASYIQGRVALEAFRRMLEGGGADRQAYLEALEKLVHGPDAPGEKFILHDYVAGGRSRVLHPEFDSGGWSVVADFRAPRAAQDAGRELTPAR